MSFSVELILSSARDKSSEIKTMNFLETFRDFSSLKVFSLIVGSDWIPPGMPGNTSNPAAVPKVGDPAKKRSNSFVNLTANLTAIRGRPKSKIPSKAVQNPWSPLQLEYFDGNFGKQVRESDGDLRPSKVPSKVQNFCKSHGGLSSSNVSSEIMASRIEVFSFRNQSPTSRRLSKYPWIFIFSKLVHTIMQLL